MRDETFDLLRRLDLTTLFSNPGSTEVPLLAGLPDDLRFVLALHEGSVVGAATGYALGRRAPAIALLHAVAGLGNAVAALATARVNRAPLVVIVGQQDRRHLAQEPFLAGQLAELAGVYPVNVESPVRPQDVPGAIGRAYHEAVARRGPALVIVPMDDWLAPAGGLHELAAATRVVRAAAADAARGRGARGPAAPRRASRPGRRSRRRRPRRLAGPGGAGRAARGARSTRRASVPGPGFPQDHELFAGHLPAARDRLRDTLRGHDLVLAVGAPVFRQYPFVPGPLVEAGTRLAVLTDEPGEAHRSPVELARGGAAGLGACAGWRACSTSAPASRRRPARCRRRWRRRSTAGCGPVTSSRPSPSACRADTVLLEEAPSSRAELHARLPARAPLGFLSAAMGGLGFALPAAIGLRMALPDRPVLAIVGDGSALYQIQALWTAARYGAGFLAIVLANGGYAIMDRLAERSAASRRGRASPRSRSTALATALGCPTLRIGDHAGLLAGARRGRADAGVAGSSRWCWWSTSRSTRRTSPSRRAPRRRSR